MDKKKDLKSSHYDKDAVSSRHRRRNQAEMRNRRSDAQKRIRSSTNTTLSANDVERMVQSLSSGVPDPLQVLRTILGTGKIAQPFFGPNNVYPNYKGPYLFTEPQSIQRLLELFKQGNLVAAECLTSIAGFEEPNTWVRVLMEMGILTIIMQHLEKPATSCELRKECWWMLSNVTIDSSTSRDFVCKTYNMVELVQNQPLDQHCIFVEVLLFVKAVFENSPIPDSSYLEPFAPIVMRGLSLCGNQDVFITTTVGQMFKNLTRYWPVQGHQWILSQEKLVTQLVQMAKTTNIRCLFVESLARLCMYEPCQERMVVQYQVVPLFMDLAVGADINTRTVSLQGLRNLANNPQSFDFLSNRQWLSRFFGMFYDTDMWIVRKELFWLLTTTIINTPDAQKSSFFMHLLENRTAVLLMDCIVASMLEYDLLFNTLSAVEIILSVHTKVAQIFVDTQGVEHIERLVVHESPQLRNSAERIITKHFQQL